MELLEWLDSNREENKTKLTEKKYFDVFFVGAICLLSLIFGVIYVLMSQTIYFWDNSTYWDIGRMLAEKPINPGFFAQIYESVGTSDYNYLAAVIPALWMKIFGITRVSYIACIITVYLIPVQFLTYFLARRISKAPRFAFLICVMMIPAVLYITTIGFIDVGGVLIGLACYYTYFKNSEDMKYRDAVLLGVFLTLIMVFRRYFAYFSVSFITAMFIDCILFKKNPKYLAVTVITAGLTLAVVFYPFLKNILLKDYGTLYSSYKYGIMTDFKLITRYFGILFIVTAFSAVPLSIIKRHDIRPVFISVQIAVCAAMFMTTQTHGQQHLLLYIPGFIALIMLLINCISNRYMLAAVCAVAAATFISPLIPREQPNSIQQIKTVSVTPTYSVKPEKRSDVIEIATLKRKLDKFIPEGETCGVLASSFELNSSILNNVIPSMNKREIRQDTYIVGLPEVDSRDYWRLNEIYNSPYILVAVPAQTHLAQSEQTIICEAVESFINNTDVAAAFSELEDFRQDIDGIECRLYKRNQEVTKTAITEFELRLYK